MRDSGGKFFEATLPVGNLGAEQILVVAIERFAFQVFVRSVSHGHGGPRQNVQPAHPKMGPPTIAQTVQNTISLVLTEYPRAAVTA